MTLVLFETPAGFALFKLLKEQALASIDTLWQEFETLDKANDIVKLKAFNRFDNTTDALAAAASLVRPRHLDGPQLASSNPVPQRIA